MSEDMRFKTRRAARERGRLRVPAARVPNGTRGEIREHLVRVINVPCGENLSRGVNGATNKQLCPRVHRSDARHHAAITTTHTRRVGCDADGD